MIAGAAAAPFAAAAIGVDVAVGSLIWVVVAYHSIHWYTAMWALAIYALVAGYLLFDEDAKAYYAGRA